jgi:putative transposase
MDERRRFVARVLDGEKMAALCREFDISRKTGYKIFQRYKDCGLDGLTDRSRRPYRHANRLPFQIEKLIVQLKRERPSWGAPKIREKLRRLHSDIQTPAISTVHAVLFRHGLVNRGRKRRHKAQGTTLSRPLTPNELWCADYKGEFMLADRRYCYPLTISDLLRQPLPVHLRSLVDHPGGVRLHRVRARVQGVRLAHGDPHRQRGALCQRPCAIRLEQTLRVVAAPGHPHRAHQARPSRAEWPP